LQDNVEELHRILQGEATTIVQLGRTLLDAPQGEGLHGTIPGFVLQASFQMQVVHLIVGKERALLDKRCTAFAEHCVGSRIRFSLSSCGCR
jgi:hypothetical protein